MTTDRLRVLILIVAYNAESTLAPVLDRLPAAVLRNYDCEVLVIDDACDDHTFEHALGYRRAHADLPLTVLRNLSNQGYGGNQKVGYTYAMQEGFDFVALIHGDGQYAPEELPNLLAPSSKGPQMRCSGAGCSCEAPLDAVACLCTSWSAIDC